MVAEEIAQVDGAVSPAVQPPRRPPCHEASKILVAACEHAGQSLLSTPSSNPSTAGVVFCSALFGGGRSGGVKESS